MSFSSLGLSADLLRAVEHQGYDAPTPVQSRSIPLVLAGHDLMAGAQTGTGKTAAFTLPMLQRLMQGQTGGRRPVRGLVLTPTRELAAQVGESVRTYGKHLPLRCAEVYGGVNINPQMRALRAGVDVLVATPGRLIDHLNRATADLSRVEILVLDEADRMLDMGFLPAIERILGRVPDRRQTLLFSATFPAGIKKLAHKFLKAPQLIEVARPNAAAEAVEQSAYLVDAGRKRALLSHLIGAGNWRQVLVFTRTKRGADRLAKQLELDGIRATAIHGDKSQGARTRALRDFKRHSVRALVATDVAARGLDINQLPHVVNYELPNNPEDYVHRIGRTGRGGSRGAAVSLVGADERGHFAAIKRLLNTDIRAHIVSGYEPTQTAAARVRSPSRAGRPAVGRDRSERRARPQASSRRGRAAAGR
jgi:ATP-dependent RNA helicase RhlE